MKATTERPQSGHVRVEAEADIPTLVDIEFGTLGWSWPDPLHDSLASQWTWAVMAIENASMYHGVKWYDEGDGNRPLRTLARWLAFVAGDDHVADQPAIANLIYDCRDMPYRDFLWDLARRGLDPDLIERLEAYPASKTLLYWLGVE